MDLQTRLLSGTSFPTLSLKTFQRSCTLSRDCVQIRIAHSSFQRSRVNRSFSNGKVVSSSERVMLCASSKTSTYRNAEPPPASIEGANRLWARFRAFLFLSWTYILAIPLFTVMLLAFPVVLLLDRSRRGFYSLINSTWATLSSWPFFQIQIEGEENLPDRTKTAVYVVNHQSYLDIFALLVLNRPFKFISKTSIFFFPIVGWSMFLTGHIMLNRMDRRSQLQCLKDCQNMISKGGSVLFFPEGTRSDNNEVQTFKKGAFSVAVNTGAPLIPITLTGTGHLMQKSRELELYSGGVKIKVHPMIQTQGAEAEVLRKETQELIASSISP